MNHWTHKTESGGWQSSPDRDWSKLQYVLKEIGKCALFAAGLLTVVALLMYADYVTEGRMLGHNYDQWGQ